MMWVFYLISMPLTLGMVLLTLKYFAGPYVPRYVLFTVGYTWFCSLSIIILVPADIWTVCQPKRVGGLGVRRLVTFNQALLGKWLWHFALEPYRLWQHVVASKYGLGKGGWVSGSVTCTYGCGLWKGIWLGWVEFWKWIRFKVGEGSRVRFWKDLWCGELVLATRFPLIFNIALDQDALVASYLDGGGVVVWNIQWWLGFSLEKCLGSGDSD
ncbi:hypothetical protein CsSME_00048157 [Camellia sinensis var. sinensis]